MAIVGLKKITLYAPTSEKEQILHDLQNIGCLHIIPLTVREDILDKRSPFSDTKEALKHLQTSGIKLKNLTDVEPFDPKDIECRSLQNKRETDTLTQESDALKKKIEDLEPWGNFILPDSTEIADQRFWFYLIPHHEMKKINHESLCLQQIHRDNRFCYVVVLSKDEPESMRGIQVQLDDEPLDRLKKRLEQIEIRLEDLAWERTQLTRFLYLFEKHIHELEDQDEWRSVLDQTWDQNPVFALQAWIPVDDVEKVLGYALEKKIAAVVEKPVPAQRPPTLLENRPIVRSGEDLISFYMTPSYWLWDPSGAVFFSFAIFFAMIFSDAGYAALLGLILIFFWKKMGRGVYGKKNRTLLLALTGFSFVWGILVGSYFGITPSPTSFIGKLKVLDVQNYSLMMAVAISVGVIHIMLANLALAWSLRKSSKAWAPIGWTLALIGGALAFFEYLFIHTSGPLKTVAFWMIGLGLALVILFSSTEKNPWRRLLGGFTGLARVTTLFGDVLSYLRLFALGLASASLASVFNNLAKQVYVASPAFKIIFFLLIILVGHGINFLLSIMSGFIHGLRLNFIEFFNWSLPDEGTAFRAFSKREGSTWNR